MIKKTIAGLIAIVAIASVVIFAGCVEEPSSAPTATPSPTTKTELSLGESAIGDDISFTVVKYEFTDSYIYNDSLEFFVEKRNKTCYPSEGAKFFWVYVEGENIGEVAYYLPSGWDIKLLYKGTTIRTSSTGIGAHLIDREEYYGGEVYPGVREEGWIFYEVPIGFDTTQAKISTEGMNWSLAP